MARRGFGSTALRAALGAVTGVAEGLQQRDVVAAEKKRMADAADRQAMLDALAMEDRAQAKEDRLRSQRERLLGSGYVREGMDMPGATPRKAVNTEMVGGERFSVYETPQQMARRAAIEEAKFKAKFKPEATMTPYQAEMIRQRELDRAARVGRAGKAEPSDETKRQLGNQYMASQARNPALMAALQNTFSNDPEAAADPGLAAYDLMKSKMIPKLGAGKGYEPPTPPKGTKASAEAMSFDSLKEEVARRKSGGAPAAAPAAAKGTGQSDAIIDQDRYAKDADYRAWVDSQNK
jgi:hypothetical protein